MTTTTEPTKVKRPRGFAAWDPAKVREVAKKGGISAHASGAAHQFSSEEASVAGRKGGLASAKRTAAKKAARDTIPAPAPQG